MKPRKIKHTGDKRRYLYAYSDLKKWLKAGREHGNVGVIPVREDSKTVTYRGFGTIERPVRDIFTVTMVKCMPFEQPPPPLGTGSAKAMLLSPDYTRMVPRDAIEKPDE